MDAIEMIARCMELSEKFELSEELGVSKCTPDDAAWITAKMRETALPLEPMGDPEAK